MPGILQSKQTAPVSRQTFRITTAIHDDVNRGGNVHTDVEWDDRRVSALPLSRPDRRRLLGWILQTTSKLDWTIFCLGSSGEDCSGLQASVYVCVELGG